MRHLNFQQDGIAETLVNFVFRVPKNRQNTWLVSLRRGRGWCQIFSSTSPGTWSCRTRLGDPGGPLWKDMDSSGAMKT